MSEKLGSARIVRERTVFAVEIDYPTEKGWRSIVEHRSIAGAEAAIDVFLPTRSRPNRIIETTTVATERIVRD